MGIILSQELSVSASLPTVGKVTIFHDTNNGSISIKRPNGNTVELGGNLNSFTTLTLNDTNATTTNKKAGSFYLTSGVLSSSSMAFFGSSIGLGTCIVDLYRESTSTLITSWSLTTGILQAVTLSNSASLPATDWYSIRFRMTTTADTAIIQGIRFVYA